MKRTFNIGKTLIFALLFVGLFAVAYNVRATIETGAEISVSTGSEFLAAVSAANSNSSVRYSVKLTGTINISAPVIVPANFHLSAVNSGKIVKSGAGAIAFAGVGLEDAARREAIFYGFSPGSIKWTGTLYPSRISTGLFDGANASARINIANAAFGVKSVEIVATKGNLGEMSTISDNRTLTLEDGVFTNNIAASYVPAFSVGSNVVVKGAGIGKTVIRETSVVSGAVSIEIFRAASSLSGVSSIDTSENISISDLTIEGEPRQVVNQAATAVFLGNTRNGYIRRIHFKGVHGFAAYVGHTNSSGFYAQNCFITENIFEAVGAQNAGVINGENITIAHNKFIKGGTISGTYSYYIDLEPNDAVNDRVKNVDISNNYFEGAITVGGRTVYGIAVQGASDVHVVGNHLNGKPVGSDAQGFLTGITINNSENVFVTGNEINGCSQTAISAQNSALVQATNNQILQSGSIHTNTLAAVVFKGVADSIVRNNNLIRERDTTGAFYDWRKGFSRQITELAYQVAVDTKTSGGATTVSINAGFAGNILPFWAGRTVNVGGADYKVEAVLSPRSFRTTTVVPNLTNATLTTKFGNNSYIDNLNAHYSLQTGSLSRVADNVNHSPTFYYNAFLAGNLSSAYTFGQINPLADAPVRIVSIAAFAKQAPLGNTTAAVIRATAPIDADGNAKPINEDLTISAQTSTRILNTVFNQSAPITLKIQRAAAGGTPPADVNVVVGYRIGTLIVYQ